MSARGDVKPRGPSGTGSRCRRCRRGSPGRTIRCSTRTAPGPTPACPLRRTPGSHVGLEGGHVSRKDVTADAAAPSRRQATLQRLDLESSHRPLACAHGSALPIGRSPIVGRCATPSQLIRNAEPDRPRDRGFRRSVRRCELGPDFRSWPVPAPSIRRRFFRLHAVLRDIGPSVCPGGNDCWIWAPK
jgi:hypothetical protein